MTGASGGIGLVTARRLAEGGARVVMVGHRPERLDAALATVRAAAPGADLEPLLADLSRQAEVRRLARAIEERCPRVDVLVNNAGAIFQRRELTADGIERTFALNHLAYFLLARLLRERLVASAPARVVNVASAAHAGVSLDFEDLNAAGGYRGWRAYQRSKLANILFTFELAERLAGTEVTANCLHPGFVATGLGGNNASWFRAGVKAAMWLGAISPERGAQTPVHLAAAPEVAGVTGRYFVACRERTPSPQARDAAARRRLWALSEEMTGLAGEGAGR